MHQHSYFATHELRFGGRAWLGSRHAGGLGCTTGRGGSQHRVDAVGQGWRHADAGLAEPREALLVRLAGLPIRESSLAQTARAAPRIGDAGQLGVAGRADHGSVDAATRSRAGQASDAVEAERRTAALPGERELGCIAGCVADLVGTTHEVLGAGRHVATDELARLAERGAAVVDGAGFVAGPVVALALLERAALIGAPVVQVDRAFTIIMKGQFLRAGGPGLDSRLSLQAHISFNCVVATLREEVARGVGRHHRKQLSIDRVRSLLTAVAPGQCHERAEEQTRTSCLPHGIFGRFGEVEIRRCMARTRENGRAQGALPGISHVVYCGLITVSLSPPGYAYEVTPV